MPRETGPRPEDSESFEVKIPGQEGIGRFSYTEKEKKKMAETKARGDLTAKQIRERVADANYQNTKESLAMAGADKRKEAARETARKAFEEREERLRQGQTNVIKGVKFKPTNTEERNGTNG